MFHRHMIHRHQQLPPGIKVIDESDEPVLPLATLRQQCQIVTIDVDSDGIDSHPDDGLLLGYLAAAVEHAEDFTGLSIALRTYEMAWDKFPPEELVLLRPPFIGLLSFVAGEDSDGEVDPDSYTIDTYGTFARVIAFSGWPFVTTGTNAIRVRFMAGYRDDSDATPLPASIKQALLLLVGHWYANRESVAEGSYAEVPQGFEALLRPKRVRLGIA